MYILTKKFVPNSPVDTKSGFHKIAYHSDKTKQIHEATSHPCAKQLAKWQR